MTRLEHCVWNVLCLLGVPEVAAQPALSTGDVLYF